ncbi:MAG: hypothetical protein JJT77_13445 [Crocinitomicaceae bacterium]|nr:hypothetical protein [Crocinitomicaceae bacterium]
MKRFLIYTIAATLLMSLALSFGACRKKEDTVARITVRDTANILVPNARVILFGQSTTDPIQPVVLRDTAFTNSSGVATFLFNDVYQLGQAGVAVLNISVSKGNLKGQGIIKIEEEVENTATVFIQP